MTKKPAKKRAKKPVAKVGERLVSMTKCPSCNGSHSIAIRPLKTHIGPWTAWGLCFFHEEPVFFTREPGASEQIVDAISHEAMADVARKMDREVLRLFATDGRAPFDDYVRALIYLLLTEEFPVNKVTLLVTKARKYVGVGTKWINPTPEIENLVENLTSELLR